MAGNGWARVLRGDDGRLRSGWRLALFLVFFLGFSIAGMLLLALFRVLDATVSPSAMSPAALFWPGLVTLAAAVGAGWVMLARWEDRPRGALGFAWTSQTGRELGLGMLIGGGSLALIVGLLALAGWVRYRPEPGTALAYVVVLVQYLVVLGVPAAAEEALFRGYPFQVVVEALGAVWATLLLSAAFAAAHVFNPNVGALALVNIFLAGVLLSVAYLRTRSLWFATAVHLGWNWSMAVVLDLPVSGLEFIDTPLYEPMAAGPAWATGGIFGPEAGVGATLAALIAIAAVVRVRGLDEPDELRLLEPIVDRVMDGPGPFPADGGQTAAGPQ